MHKYLLSLAALVLTSAALAADAPTEGLVGYWNFDEVENGIVKDASGNGNDGTVTNAPFTEKGRINGCLSFDGRTSVVNCGPAAEYNISEGITVTAWIRPEMQGRHRFLAYLSDNDGFMFGFEATMHRLAFRFGNSETQENYGFYSRIWTRPAKWNHVAITYSEKTGVITCYHDGLLLGTERWFNGPIAVPDTDLLLGSDGRFHHKGLLDEVRLYNRALSSEEIKQVYNDLPNIPAAGVQLAEEAMTLALYDDAQLDYQVLPWHATDQHVLWNSSDTAVVTVTNDGYLNAVGPGTATITAKIAGTPADTCRITVETQHPEEVTLNQDALSIEQSLAQQLTANISPADTTDKSLTWSSSDPTVATVDAEGRVTAHSPGTATITAKTVDNGKTAECAVTVWMKPIEKIALAKKQLHMQLGQFERLTANVHPEDATWRHYVHWTSSDPAVAEVDQTGMVIAKSSGKTQIAVETKNGGFVDACEVEVAPYPLGTWQKVLVLRDYLADWEPRWPPLQRDWYDFEEELLSYKVQFPPQAARAGGLQLTSADGKNVPIQLSDASYDENGWLKSATVSFRSSLQLGGIKTFVLTSTPMLAGAQISSIKTTPIAEHTLIIAANRQQIKVYRGRQTFDPPKPADEVPAPIIGLARDGEDYTGPATLVLPENIRVTGIAGEVLEHGTLFTKYRVTYAFTGEREYSVVLTLQHDEKHLLVDEYISGFAPEDDAWLKFSYKKAVDPDGRLVESNGSYKLTRYKGHYDEHLRKDGRIPYELGQYTPNSYGLNYSTVFWKDSGPHGLIFSVNRLEDWQPSEYFVWSSFGPHNLAFYCTSDDKYMITRLEGKERHWAVGLIPRDEVMLHNRRNPEQTYLIDKDFTDSPLLNDKHLNRWTYGPEHRLYRKLSDHSLNWNKNLILDWNTTQWLDLPNCRTTGLQYVTERAREVHPVYVAAGDSHMPHISMMAGHPNFVIYHKLTLADGLRKFPNHPEAEMWKQQYLNFYEKWLDLFVRKADPEYNTAAGRFMENIACYSLHSMQGVLRASRALREYDGTDLWSYPDARKWIDWYMHVMMPTEKSIRLVPPQGAHAAAGIPPEKIPHGPSRLYRKNMVEIARRLSESDATELGETFLWTLTKGTRAEEGKKMMPIESKLYTDYGAVLWYDCGGPNEAYVNIQQLYGRGYRWSPRNNGMIYYCADGRRWSWNGDEEAGDQFNIKQLTVFNVNGSGLDRHITDGVLYNFGGAQFYRANGSNGPYLSRSVMMLRDDYIAVYDDVEGEAEGTFQWRGGRPHIYRIKEGPGDNLHIVAPRELKVEPASFGAVVNGKEYVFMSDGFSAVSQKKIGVTVSANAPPTTATVDVSFSGRTGYAREGELALFEGDSISFGDFAISREGGEFGVSARVEEGTITGRITGRQGGTVAISLPAELQEKALAVQIEGQKIPHSVDGGKLSFAADISITDGYKSYSVKVAE